MIARIWHGFATKENAGKYEAMLKPDVLPGLDKVAGYRGSYLLRRDHGAEIEFITLMLWESIDAIRVVAGEHYEVAIFPRSAGKFCRVWTSAHSTTRSCKVRGSDSLHGAIEPRDPKRVGTPASTPITGVSHSPEHLVR